MLTPRQERFIEHYLIDLNATQSAIRAGYSEKTANQQGPRLLEIPAVREAIDAAKTHRSEATEITSQRVLEEIASVAFYDPAEIMIEIARVNRGEGQDHGLRGPSDIRCLPEHIRRVITGWTWDRNGNFSVKIADKLRALDQLARHLSLYNDRVQVSPFDGLAERLERIRQLPDDMPPRLEARPPSTALAAADPDQAEPVASLDVDCAPEPERPSDPEPELPPSPAAPPAPAVPLYQPVMPRPEPSRYSGGAAFANTDYLPLHSEDS